MLDIRLTRTHARAVALVDIGDSAVSVAICRVEKTRAQIVSTGYSAPSNEPRDRSHAEALLLTHLREAADKAAGGSPVTIDAAYVVLHSPFSASKTIATEGQHERRVRVQDTAIAQMAREALAEAQPDRTKLMEGSVMRIELNGYPTGEPAGKWASRIKIVSLLSECEPSLKSAVESELHARFPAASILWRSGVRACAAFSRATHVLGDDYSILDMGAETSQLVSIRSGELDTRSMPVGLTTVLTKIAPGKSGTETLSALRMLESGASSGESAEALQKEMARAEPEIVKALADGIGQIAAGRRISNKLLLLAHHDLESWLLRLLSRIDFSQFTVTTLPFDVRTPHMITGASHEEGALLVGLELVNSEISAGA